MPKFLLNGEPRDEKEGATMARLLERLDLSPKSVIVELNREFLERDKLDSTIIHEDDRVEIARAFAGG